MCNAHLRHWFVEGFHLKLDHKVQSMNQESLFIDSHSYLPLCPCLRRWDGGIYLLEHDGKGSIEQQIYLSSGGFFIMSDIYLSHFISAWPSSAWVARKTISSECRPQCDSPWM